MLAIKLQRVGRRHQPAYRVVVAEKRSKLRGPGAEDLGSYNPFTKIATLNKERISHWLKIGVQPTVTVHNLLVREGLISAPKIRIKTKVKKGETQTQEASVPQTLPPAAPQEGQAAPASVPATAGKPADTQ